MDNIVNKRSEQVGEWNQFVSIEVQFSSMSCQSVGQL